MKCPVCVQTDLVMSERKGIEIDYCPSCRGIWLDRGELDKLIERSAEADVQYPRAPQGPVHVVPQPLVHPHAPMPEPSQSPGPNYYWDGRKWKRKKSWFEEIFD